MGRTRLLNSTWGFESNCFVCEPGNESGLRLAFELDDELAAVVCEFELDGRYSGIPAFVHGGVTLAILDEAMAWATVAIAQRWAVTAETTSRFLRPVKIGRPYRVVARVTSSGDERVTTAATVLDRHDHACVESEAAFHVLSATQAVRAIGVDLGGEHTRYLRRDQDH